MDRRHRAPDPRRISRLAAEILARVIAPEKADWSSRAARDLLRLRFADQDCDRLHRLLARRYRDMLTEEEEEELEKHLFVNCLLSLIHERARRSLDRRALTV